MCMDKIALLQKHLTGFKELKPDNRSKPRVPQKTKKLTKESHDTSSRFIRLGGKG